jgi:hypothetical protein
VKPLTKLKLDFDRDPAKATPLVSISIFSELVAEKDLCMLRADFLPQLKKKVCRIP